jgi:hypothetical protein
MSASENVPPILPEPAPPVDKTLRRLFLILFLRGRALRGLNRQGAPKSIGEKLALTLFFYLLMGCMALMFANQSVFALAVYLHAMTFAFLGMFVAASAGEILFNKEEGDILMHRPVSSRAMLWAKIRVLIEVSLWLAVAFNLVGLFVGFGTTRNWLFPLVHLFATGLEALFCTGCVVLVYQLCLRWFGRERLDSLMTIAQVIVSIAAITASQLLPQLAFRLHGALDVSQVAWWINLLPPAWFAGLDDAVAGSRMRESWLLSGLALGVTAVVLWLAFVKLARNYESGLQSLNETLSPRITARSGPRWLDRLVDLPPLRWWLRDPVTRASFLLTSAYLMRDRDVKLRVYPGIAPVLVIPVIFLLRGSMVGTGKGDPGFGVPLSGIYLGLVPLFGVRLLQYSQQWQATDVFRAAPLAGPMALCEGVRRAVLLLLTLPMLALVTLIVWFMRGSFSELLLILPGLIALPAFSLVPMIGGQGVPLSLPTDAAKAAGRSLNMILVTAVAFALSGLTSVAWSGGWFWWLVLGELAVVGTVYTILRFHIKNCGWPAETT